MSTVPLELNPALDPRALAAQYIEKKRLQIRAFLAPESAEAAHQYLEELPWGLAYNDGTHVEQLHAHMVADLGEREAAEIMAGIRERARRQYQFLYGFYPILTAYFSPQVARHRIFKFFELINSRPAIDLIREVTGLADIRWADGAGDVVQARTLPESAYR